MTRTSLGCLAILGIFLPSGAQCQNSGELTLLELLGLGAASVGVSMVGDRVSDFDVEKPSLWPTPPAWDLAAPKLLGGKPRPGKRNFLDTHAGGAATPVGGWALLGLADIGYAGGVGRPMVQDMAIYASGLLTTKGVTEVFKGTFRRPRPLTHLAPELAAADRVYRSQFHHSSFISGHTSAAFFAATFLDRYFRVHMKQDLSRNDYREQHRGMQNLLYAWATFVGLSRIQAQRHYPTDVLAGAVVGSALGFLFAAIADDHWKERGRDYQAPLMLTFSFRF
jgi:membrane-associated phospholipid phosphatase